VSTRARHSESTSRRRRGARALGLLAATALALSVVVPALDGPSAGPLAAREASASDAGATLVGLINSARQNQGLSSLTVAGDLTSVAAARAQAVADAGALSHTPDLGSRVCCWTWIGENVGYAYSVRQVHDLFMASSEHRANILAPQATDVGVAVVNRGGTLWVAEVFRARTGTSSRSSDASQPSRSQDRAPQPSGSSSAPVTSATTTGSTSVGATRAPRWSLDQELRTLRDHLRHRLAVHGRLDPLLAAVRYAGTLERVNH
jgi:Cysteine-rich secretory protein family